MRNIRCTVITTWCVLASIAGCALTGRMQAQDTAPAQPAAPGRNLVPAFKVRARVITMQNKAPAGQKFYFLLGGAGNPLWEWDSVNATGSDWSNWGTYTPEANNYPAKEWTSIFPLLLALHAYTFSTVPDATYGTRVWTASPLQLEVQIQLDEQPDKIVTLSPTLAGNHSPQNIPGLFLGLLLWRGEADPATGKFWKAGGQPRVMPMREFNQKRYWNKLKDVQVPVAERPRHFIIADRFMTGDHEVGLREDAAQVFGRLGFTAVGGLPAPRDLQKAPGVSPTLRRTVSTSNYTPPGGLFPHHAKIISTVPWNGDYDAWAKAEAKPFLDAGFAPQDVALFGISDEPGWIYPAEIEHVMKDPAALERFRTYLKAQGLQPADVGAAGWDQVLPSGPSAAKDLPSRRLYYWTMRFFPHESAQHYAATTRALQKAFHPDLRVFTNWANFNARFYGPGPGNILWNPVLTTSPDVGEGSHDWLEFGRLRGGTVLWTEDWFGDTAAYVWSFYNSLLRSAARKSGVEFGGYIIGRTAGDRPHGVLQKALSIAGHGGKTIFYYTFGPDYIKGGDAYSDTPGSDVLMPQIAEANRAIGEAEELLWPGKPPRAPVAILHPQSAQLWDVPTPTTGPQPLRIKILSHGAGNSSTVDYVAEVFNLYLALQHANIPVEWVDEEDLTAKGLSPYKALYVTALNIPTEGIQGIKQWVNAGGTLVTVIGAGTHDRYNEPSTLLSDFTGLKEEARPRFLIEVLGRETKPPIHEANGAAGAFKAIVRGKLAGSAPAGATVEAKWADDNSPAIVQRVLGKGRVYHYTFMPGLSYIYSSEDMLKLTGATPIGRFPTGFSSTLRDWIARPIRQANVQPPVALSTPMIETPLLLSDKGAAVTLLNWNNEPQKNLSVTVKVPFAVGSAGSVQQGKLTFKQAVPGQVTVTLPNLDAADVLMLRPR